MSGCLSLCPYKMNTNIVLESQNPNTNPNPNSTIRRTMSAEMSTQKWLQNNGFPLKRAQSSEQLQVLGEEDHGMEKKSDHGGEDGNKGGSGGAAFEDIWSSILSQKKLDGSVPGSGQVPPPYVHPLVKRSTSSLSEKSLEICTESLGSETGSDGLFSYPASEHGESSSSCSDKEEEEEEEKVHEVDEERSHVEEMRGYVEMAKYNYPVNNKKVGAPKSFPPPLPSLAHRDDGSNLLMRTHRQDGRLVVEAVAVPSQNCFRAQRHNGRLLLTLTHDDQQGIDDDDDDGGGDGDEMGLEDEIIDDDDEMIDEDDVDEEEAVGETAEKLAIVKEETSNMATASRIINVDNTSSAMIMSKLMELTCSRNKSTWHRNYNKPVIKSLSLQDEDDVVEEEVKVEAKQKAAKLLPPRPSTATAVLNSYEYYWRRSDSPTAAALAVLKPLAGNHSPTGAVSPQVVKQTNRNKNNTFLLGQAVPPQEMVLLKAAAVAVGGVSGENPEYVVPMFRGCKEPRRSLFFWDPFCIPTS